MDLRILCQELGAEQIYICCNTLRTLRQDWGGWKPWDENVCFLVYHNISGRGYLHTEWRWEVWHIEAHKDRHGMSPSEGTREERINEGKLEFDPGEGVDCIHTAVWGTLRGSRTPQDHRNSWLCSQRQGHLFRAWYVVGTHNATYSHWLLCYKEKN
jgi:hypothetical protein